MSFEKIFKAYDIRGKVGEELNPKVVYKVSRAFAKFLDGGPIAVGHDMRDDSRELADAFMAGLTDEGREVWDIGQVTTDMIYFAVGEYGLSGGAMITASHNPGEYNGIKFCQKKAQAIGKETGLMKIKELAESIEPKESPNINGELVRKKEVLNDWVEHALSFRSNEWKSNKMVVDAGNGMAGKVIPVLEEKIELSVDRLYFELDGSFPNHEANPLKEETLDDIKKEIKDKKLDFGVAFDGDGDRAVLIDENSKPISGTIMTAMLAKKFLKESPGSTVLYNAICGNIVPETIRKFGGIPVRTRVGHSYIKKDMQINEAIFAGEHSGHYYFKDNWNADSGLIAMISVIDLLNEEGKKLSELAGEFDVYASSGEINFEVNDKKKALDRLSEIYNEGEQDRLDGVTVRFDEWWFNVRPSNTEPLLRLNVEAEDKKVLDEKVSELKETINEFE